MSIMVNTGLIAQNNDAMNAFQQKYVGDAKKLTSATGTMRELSEEEIKAIREAKKNEQTTLKVDSSEIVNNIYSKTRDNVTYSVDGVEFSNKEMTNCKDVVKQAISLLPTMGSDLDYENYASMGIVTNMVNAYATEHLTEEQMKVVNKSIEDYISKLVQTEKEQHLKTDAYTVNTKDEDSVSGVNQYYGVRRRLNDEAEESFKKVLTSNIPQEVSSTLLTNLQHARETGSVVQSASNEELAGKIKELFARADMKSADSLKTAFEQYKEWMTSVYETNGITNTARNASLTRVINGDINALDYQISTAKNIVSSIGKKVDFAV